MKKRANKLRPSIEWSILNIKWMIYFLAVLSLGCFTGLGYANDQVIRVELDEWQVSLDKQAVGPGKVVFKATNKGELAHEMVVIKTDLPADRFEVAHGKVKEDAVGEVMGEIEGFPPKTEETLTLNLSKGSYVLFCNNLEKGKVEGHYQKGMRIQFTVR